MAGSVGAELGLGDANAIGPRGDPAERRLQDGSRQPDPDSEGQGTELSAWVDPLQRALAQPLLPSRESAAQPPSHPTLAMDEIERAVRRIAWGGDRQRSIAYIELAAGELSGATLTLEARGRAVSIVVDVAPGTSTAGWAERLAERLAGRGLEVESVLVR